MRVDYTDELNSFKLVNGVDAHWLEGKTLAEILEMAGSGGGGGSTGGGGGNASFLGVYNNFVATAAIKDPKEGDFISILKDETCEGIKSYYVYHKLKWTRLNGQTFTVSGSEPIDKTLLWIDISGSDPILKYYNGVKWAGLGSVGGQFKKFPVFEANTSYSFNDVIMVNGKLFSAKASFQSGEFYDSNDWNLVAGDMTRSVYDKNNDGIIDHAEYSNVAAIALETSLLQSWRPNTNYKIGQQLVYLNKIYTVIKNHISEDLFETSSLDLTATGYHNELYNIMGGKPNEYYHLDKLSHDLLLRFNLSNDKLYFDTSNVGDMVRTVYDKNNDGIVDFADKLTGMTISIQELNNLQGSTGNIQQQLNSISKGMVFKGVIPTYADLVKIISPTTGYTVVVEKDETQAGVRTLYIYGDSKWVCLGLFEFVVRDFSVEPINLATETTGIVTDDKIDASIARKRDLHTHTNLSVIESYTNSDVDISDSISKKHNHLNKMVIDTYTNTNVDISDAISRKHTHTNKAILDYFTEDVTGKLLYKGSLIEGAGGGGAGLSDLSMFTTNDLKDSLNKRYITDNEKGNLALLPSIVNEQSTIATSLSAINQKISINASATNKLVDKAQMDTALTTVKFINLSDVDKQKASANAVLVMDATSSKVTFKSNFDDFYKIKKITDKNNSVFTDTKFIKFNNLIGVPLPDGTIEFKHEDLLTTSLLDMPSSYENDSVLVANKDTMKYELKLIADLTNSKENYATTLDIADWTYNAAESRYEKIIAHYLNSKNLIVASYDSFEMSIPSNYRITSPNEIVIFSTKNVFCKVVINCSQGAVTSSRSIGGGTVSASDFIDDLRVRLDKTYSSNKIMSVLDNYSLKASVYSKAETDAKYALKDNDHAHTNINVINKFTSDTFGNIYFDNKKLLMNIEPFTHQQKWTNESLDTLNIIADIATIFQDKNMKAIMNNEFIIQNMIASVDEATDLNNALRLVIADNNIIVLDILIPPGSVQKHILGISPNVKIMVKGQFTANLCMNSY